MESTIVRLVPVCDGVDILETPAEMQVADRMSFGEAPAFVLSSWAKRTARSMRVALPPQRLAS